MANSSSGMNYAPVGKPAPVVKLGEFVFAATHLAHGHIYGQCNGLTEAGAQLKWVYDEDPEKVAKFVNKFPTVKVAKSFEEILDDSSVHLVASAAIPNIRSAVGQKVIEAGKDYFTDKTPFTKMSQLQDIKKLVKDTGKKYMVYFSERLHVESAMYATDIVKAGAIGKVLQVISLAPHKLDKPLRPDWFFNREEYGGILCDIGSHQFEQFLAYSGATDATVEHAAVANYANPDKPELEDFGEANLLGNNGATNYVRVDWFTPKGLNAFGDGRTIILGTKGYIELRKYANINEKGTGEKDNVYIVDDNGVQFINVAGKVGFRFFGELILDCLNRTEKAMTQEHAFKAAELCLLAQEKAKKIPSYLK